MHEPIPSCFRGRAAGAPPPSTVAGPRLTTSSYVTQLGLTVLTWSRTVFGLSLRIDLRLANSAVGGGGNSPDADEEEPIRLRVRPWLLWKRRGSKRIHLHDVDRRRTIDIVWDLTRARFPAGGGPEPAAGYFVVVDVDDDMLVAAGDMCDEAYKKTKSSRPWAAPVLISRKEHVSLVSGQGQSSYKTTAVFEGKQQEIAIEIGSATKESSMSERSKSEQKKPTVVIQSEEQIKRQAIDGPDREEVQAEASKGREQLKVDQAAVQQSSASVGRAMKGRDAKKYKQNTKPTAEIEEERSSDRAAMNEASRDLAVQPTAVINQEEQVQS